VRRNGGKGEKHLPLSLFAWFAPFHIINVFLSTLLPLPYLFFSETSGTKPLCTQLPPLLSITVYFYCFVPAVGFMDLWLNIRGGIIVVRKSAIQCCRTLDGTSAPCPNQRLRRRCRTYEIF
jgi:hypothetical protein